MPRIVPLALAAAVLATSFSSGVTAAEAGSSRHFVRTATFAVHTNLPAGADPASATAAEISTVSSDGRTLIYSDSPGKRIGFVDISNPDKPKPAGTLSLAVLGDADDEPTSVAVAGGHVLVVVNTSASFTSPSGRLDVIRLRDRQRVRSIDLGGQPDSIAVSPDGSFAAIAIENERDEEATPDGAEEGDLPQLPAGFVQLVSLRGSTSSWQATPVPLVNADGSALPVLAEAGLDTPTDPEPEYVAVNGKSQVAVTLQENNGVVIIDARTARVVRAFSAGTASVGGIDTVKDGAIDQNGSITDVPREPDAIAWIGNDRLATANEGDWKGGTRGWTIFDTAGRVRWDSGNSLERLAVQYGLHNEDRAAKKGVEPEGLAVATYRGTRYAFVASERSNFVAVYTLNTSTPKLAGLLPTTNGPEGVLPITKRGLLAISSETDDASAGVRSAISLYRLDRVDAAAAWPTIRSTTTAGVPLGWSALGALSAKPGSSTTLYAAADTVIADATIYTVDVGRTPALITSAIPVTRDGQPAKLDVEGIYARPAGGFWLAGEGATGAGNKLIRTNSAGAILKEVSLPEEVTAKVGKWGLEGVTGTIDAGGEHVWFVLQRPLWSVVGTTPLPEEDGIARIGRYDVATGTFHWYGYRLEATTAAGDWMGLSEITAIDDHTFAVIERDKLNGPAARVKRVYTVSVPTDDGLVTDPGGQLPVLDKSLALDVLPALRATRGWTQEKLEGFAIAGGRVYAVTDNDGLKDATGETVFL
ncbi:MAG: esterase-like activity of phytase family protein, partial [Propionibacteriaceae bacterium]|nr:esterase-like activity of phytase family protein [Propionibacteriaceae bacterium]